MATSLRVEFVQLGRGGFAENVITSIRSNDDATKQDTPATVALTTSGLSGNAQIPAPSSLKNGDLYARLTAIGGPAHVLISSAGTVATLTNGIRLVQDLPEIFALKSGSLISAVAET